MNSPAVSQFSRFKLFFLPAVLCLVAVGAGHAQDSVPQLGFFETSFEIDLEYENPYDSEDIRVDATILSAGFERQVPCFFDGENGWILRFTPKLPGDYSFRVNAVTRQESKLVHSGEFVVTPRRDRGFVRIDNTRLRHFSFENNDSYFPLGENLGWVSPARLSTWTDYLRECENAGINWIRIWMCPWGRTEIEWTGNSYHGLGTYSLQNARMIDGIFREAEQRGIYIQWVINHHGQYSIKTNPVWDQNPYNTRNGGFLRSPDEFFRDEEAKRHYRDRLRYLVARWGYSTHLMAWEFWNEVNLTANFHFETVKSWHEEMSAYLRTIDPYNHLQTTSGSGDYDRMENINGLDYLQTHAYITGIIDKIMNTSKRAALEHPDRPHFFGELSYDYRGPNKGDRDGVILHNQLWASVHGWDSGTAMTWWWDNWVRPYDLYYHFEALSHYVDEIDWLKQELLPLGTKVTAHPRDYSDFVFGPGLGWAETDRERFIINRDGTVEGLGRCSSFVHGQYHREMAPNPIFEIDLKHPAQFGFEIGTVARAGAGCSILLDGERVERRVFPARNDDYDPAVEGEFSISVPSGKHEIAVKNNRSDWFRVERFWVEDFVPRPLAYARGDEELILLWIHDRPHRYAVIEDYGEYGPLHESKVSLPQIRTGVFEIHQFDTYTGERERLPSVEAGPEGLTVTIQPFEKDIAFHLKRVDTAVGIAPLH